MELKAGMRLCCLTSTAELIVVKPPAGPVEVAIDGDVLAAAPAGDENPRAGGDATILLGKRYTDEDGAIELLCVRPGAGTLAFNGREMVIKGAKPVPSSD